VKALLIIATLADFGLAALLIGISGFIFGGGHEGMHGAPWPAIGWGVAFVACFAAPLAGFALFRRGQDGLGALIGWLPPIAGLALAFAPINPY